MMVPAVICEYCGHICAESEAKEHEDTCSKDYTKRSCTTCKHWCLGKNLSYRCKVDNIDRQEKVENCENYERTDSLNPVEAFIKLLGG